MKKEELKDIMEETLKTAKSLLIKDSKLIPVAFVRSEDNVDVIGLSFKDNEENMQLFLLKKLVKMKNANAIFIVTESWYVTSDKKDLKIEPSKHPMRKECIFIYGECEEGNITLMQVFNRKDNDEIVFGEKLDHIDCVSLKFDFGIKENKKQESRNLN